VAASEPGAQESSARDPGQEAPESIPASGELRSPIFSNPTPDQLVYLDQPDPDEALVEKLSPGTEWWCFYGTIPANNNRTSFCERTMAACDQHSQFMVTASRLKVEPCQAQKIAFCKTQSMKGKLRLDCQATESDCRAGGELMVRAGLMHYSKNCVGMR
jgi:hypothetical protein